ncbi:hypothetical protein ACFW16_32725 [Inquilinus sp. NPDC058860]|uniref:hypothetical protein n=1 Tax=Inquilinus sp. NPDC058860 TaxID=3346652 RepID=UPI003693B4DF
MLFDLEEEEGFRLIDGLGYASLTCRETAATFAERAKSAEVLGHRQRAARNRNSARHYTEKAVGFEALRLRLGRIIEAPVVIPFARLQLVSERERPRGHLPPGHVITIGTEFRGAGDGRQFVDVDTAARFAAEWVLGLNFEEVGTVGDVRLIVTVDEA